MAPTCRSRSSGSRSHSGSRSRPGSRTPHSRSTRVLDAGQRVGGNPALEVVFAAPDADVDPKTADVGPVQKNRGTSRLRVRGTLEPDKSRESIETSRVATGTKGHQGLKWTLGVHISRWPIARSETMIAAAAASERGRAGGRVARRQSRPQGDERRHSPHRCLGATKEHIHGYPKDEPHLDEATSTRSNLTLRMQNRLFTRLTNAFSKEVGEPRAHGRALYTSLKYTSVKMHKSVGMTPALAAGVTDRLWEMSDLVALVDKVRRHARRAEGGGGSRRLPPESVPTRGSIARYANATTAKAAVGPLLHVERRRVHLAEAQSNHSDVGVHPASTKSMVCSDRSRGGASRSRPQSPTLEWSRRDRERVKLPLS